MFIDDLPIAPNAGWLFLSICDSLSHGVCVFDESGKYIFVNRAYCEILGYDPADLRGLLFTHVLPPELHQLAMHLHNEFLAGLALPPAEWLMRCKNGTNIPVRATNRLLAQDDGLRLRVVIVEDLSALKTLEHERDELLLRLNTATRIDQATQVHNRQALMATAATELQRARRYNHTLTVVLCDLDHFTRLSDSYGHSVGDEVLRHVAFRLRQLVRVADTVGRYVGEEFALLLPLTDERGGLETAQRLRAALAATPIPTSAGALSITASFGVAEVLPADSSIEPAFSRAGVALHAAKSRGRNRVATASAGVDRRKA